MLCTTQAGNRLSGDNHPEDETPASLTLTSRSETKSFPLPPCASHLPTLAPHLAAFICGYVELNRSGIIERDSDLSLESTRHSGLKLQRSFSQRFDSLAFS